MSPDVLLSLLLRLARMMDDEQWHLMSVWLKLCLMEVYMRVNGIRSIEETHNNHRLFPYLLLSRHIITLTDTHMRKHERELAKYTAKNDAKRKKMEMRSLSIFFSSSSFIVSPYWNHVIIYVNVRRTLTGKKKEKKKEQEEELAAFSP